MAVAFVKATTFLPLHNSFSRPNANPHRHSVSLGIPPIYGVATQPDIARPQREVLPLTIRQAFYTLDLQGAAALRSHTFLSFPSGRSPSFAERHRKTRAEDEWHVLEAKIAGTEPGFKRVACLIALCDYDALPEISDELDSTCAVELIEGRERWVVGTLDVNLGPRLPGEELAGHHPKGEDSGLRRAYLSNVCVALAARRRGVAGALLQESKQLAFQWGIEDLYVHVVAENQPARELYRTCGFAFEQEETAASARLLCRPRRLLLRNHLDSTLLT